MERLEPVEAWASRQASALPKRWESRLLERWNSTRTTYGAGDFLASVRAETDANIELRETVAGLKTVRTGLDATDGDIVRAAATLAGRAFELAHLYRDEQSLFDALCRVAAGQGVTPPKVKRCKDIPPAIKRLSCPQWWRRQLRRVHAKHVEGAAIALGYVNKSRDRYVSNESVIRRAQQNQRNTEAMEATTATNEDGDEYTLAELAAKGPANKAIRRAELMTRIAGFERIALDMGHSGIFMTITCPSRMHKWSTSKTGGGVFENRRYDGTLPGQAQKHLAKTWAQIRAAAARQSIKPYGFRIAEPNHDGTPHWHCLFFVAPEKVEAFTAIVWKYALKDSPNEPGAHQHRVDVKPIEAGKGTAAGYIAKYVAKNIDGYALKTDLCGGQYLEADSVSTAQRVEAWASTWGIRQFQQIGGPPVGPWRELRRVDAMPAGAPAHLVAGFDAVNSAKHLDAKAGREHDLEQEGQQAAAWDKYVKAQGGVFCGRAYAIRVTMQDQEGTGRYGEPLAAKPIGVETVTRETYTPAHMAWMGGKATRLVEWFVESTRHAWTITRRAGEFLRETAKRFAPWTCVNNCTPPGVKNQPGIVPGDPWPGGIPVLTE